MKAIKEPRHKLNGIRLHTNSKSFFTGLHHCLQKLMGAHLWQNKIRNLFCCNMYTKQVPTSPTTMICCTCPLKFLACQILRVSSPKRWTRGDLQWW